MFTTILLPTDGSDHATAAAEHGIHLASGWQATVHVLSVAEPFIYLNMYSTQDFNALEERSLDVQATTASAVDELAATAREQDIEVVTEIRRGVPHEEILAYASEYAIDLIIMGTHGRTGIDRFLAGSVTEYVIRKSEMPVLVL